MYSNSEPDSIVQQRKKYGKELLQPRRGDTVSKEFCDAYPKQARKMFKPEEIRNAKEVWR
jgi:hypothetical protein